MSSYVEFKYSNIHKASGPIIPILVKGNELWHEVWGFVDTGATYSIFQPEEAERLGIDLTIGRRISVVVGDGKSIAVYLHRLKIKISSHEIFATIGFSKELKVDLNLIGRKDIFNNFKVCFNDKNGIISFLKI